ncbi:nose resistant to fluoxetine protein 6-like [Macrosteles quadrilineatus]|uniref:nose resistant to fluoxetine protein 6-like n=1 Tax=Macrosteles quadrilineatus TaxID=74068 RepID=UPI0023E2F616|nr:nose resistant to fluoxetine protein 6-like [Macrosteles quadrilineatus]
MGGHLVLLMVIGLTTCVVSDKIDDMVPKILHRLAEVREILAPLPKEVLDEAMYHTATYYIPIDSELDVCRNHSSLLFDAFLNYEIWALKMVDASSKGGSGLLDGNIMDLGNHGQCLSARHPQGLFGGQLCAVETRGILPLDMDSLNPKRPILPTLRIDLMFSVCVPDSCSSRDVKTHMDLALNSVNASAIIYNSSCSSVKPLPWTRGDRVAMLVVIVILLLVTAGTWFDNSSDNTDVCWSELLRSFSVSRNCRSLLDTSHTCNTPRCLSGLRVIAMAWMMLGYRMIHLLACPNFRFKYLAENIDNIAWAPVENAQLSVEIFFLITGVKVTYNYFRHCQAGRGFSNKQFLLHHYLRLTPPLALVVLLYATVLVRVTEGPVWRRLFVFQQEFCQKHWWANLLYISNYITPYEMCIPQTWYLAVEFQMYIFSPLLLIPLYRNSRWGFFFLGVTFFASTLGGIINAYLLEIQAGGLIRMDRTREGTNILDYFYTQYRLASFLIGIYLGYLVFKINKGQIILKITKVQKWAGWIVSSLLILTSVLSVSIFQDPEYVYTPWLDSTYGILHRPALSLGVGWIILACSTGNGG